MAISKYDLKKINSLIGKTITAIDTKETWNETGIESIKIICSDGTQLTVSSLNGAGCSECDPEGCNESTLNIC